MPINSENGAEQIRRILRAAAEAQHVASGLTKRMFDQNRVLQLALERLVQNIGESSDHLSSSFVSANDHIPWAKIIGMRHRLVHDFTAVDLEIVWDTVQVSVPQLITELRRILEDM
ncbi:MAG: DUF86 domain-containing protein [Chloroflexi bacterium]|nr:DUF86 domain-containing protein [Chloroflexota bacterium]